jgi:predicted Zn-dependent protease
MMSMGNRELLSTIIFYHTSFYYGEKTAWRKEEAELRRVYDTLKKATAQGTLSWIKPAIPKLNELLEKGHTYRTWDWYLPFFLAANYYFQLDDPVRAAYYLKDASRLKPESHVFSCLTARMFYEGDQTETAIAFLKSMILDTKSPLLGLP